MGVATVRKRQPFPSCGAGPRGDPIQRRGAEDAQKNVGEASTSKFWTHIGTRNLGAPASLPARAAQGDSPARCRRSQGGSWKVSANYSSTPGVGLRFIWALFLRSA